MIFLSMYDVIFPKIKKINFLVRINCKIPTNDSVCTHVMLFLFWGADG